MPKAWTNSEYSGRVNTHAENVLSNVDANPGITAAQISTNLSINLTNVQAMLDAWIEGDQIVEKDDAGTQKYWTFADWASTVKSTLADVITHLGSVSDPDLISDIATALTVSEVEVEAATLLGQALFDLKYTDK